MRHAPQEVTIINFHGIGEPTRELEPGEAPFWLSRDQFCTTLDHIADHPNRHRFAITFDDSNLSDLTIAVPELKSREMTAAFFILTGRLGAPGSLDKANVKEIANSGMAIGSHGIGHRDLTSLDSGDLDAELVQSKAVLESFHGEPIDAFSIPFGRYNARVLGSLRKAGYSTAFTSDGGNARMEHFLRPRRSLRNDMSTTDIDRLLLGTTPVLRRLRRSIATTVKRIL